MSRSCRTALIAAAAFLSCGAVRSAEPTAPAERHLSAFQRLTDLVPERVAAFRQAMAEMGGQSVDQPELYFESKYQPPDFRLGNEKPVFSDDDSIIVPPGVANRDAWFDEQYVIAGRENDFEDAAQKWVERRVKGSDAAAAARGNRFAPKYAWDGGPLAGFRRGPVSFLAGADQWHVRWTHKMARPGWVTRVNCGVEDGDQKIAFTIGRSLYQASR